MGLLDGDVAAAFGTIMGTFYRDALLIRRTITHDGQGGGSSAPSETACKAQLDKTTERLYEGNTETFQQIYVLQRLNGVQLADPTTDDEIDIDGRRWQIALIEVDPAGAYWLLMGTLSDGEAS